MDVKIEEGVPMSKARKPSGKWGFLVNMKAGQSFFVGTDRDRSRCRSISRYYRIKIAIRRDGEGWRIWRIE
jgi:hypothetical protein